MGQTPSHLAIFYIAIRGEQFGPYTEKQVVQEVKREDLSDVLVWYEGLDNWYPIAQVAPFDRFFEAPESINAPSVADAFAEKTSPGTTIPREERRKKKGKKPPPIPSTFADDINNIKPVFESKESRFSRPAFFTTRLGLTLFFLALMVGFTVAIEYWANHRQRISETLMQAARKNLGIKQTREQRLRKALSQLILQPKEMLPVLELLTKENPKDRVGREALKASVEYLRRNRRYVEAGTLLMKVQRPLEAAEFFLLPPADNKRAELALFRAYETSKKPEQRQKVLLRNIALLLGPLNSVPTRRLATARIRLFSKEFPKAEHPFGYYLMSTEQKINEIFSRVLFHFVDGIKDLLDQRFPDISLAAPPKIRIARDHRGRYRIEAKYRGDVLLGRDRLSNITLRFWSFNNQWQLIETNLTQDRQRWAAKQKKRLSSRGLSPDQMLAYLERVHLSRFPKTPLHAPTPLRSAASVSKQK